MNTRNQSGKESKFFTQILTPLFMIFQQMMFLRTCRQMLKNGFPVFPVGKNKKVLGVFKDECNGKIMTEFVALRAKCYSYLLENGKGDKKVKGVKKKM